jgi:hypothetical protein
LISHDVFDENLGVLVELSVAAIISYSGTGLT